ncbi:hypothetical protein A1Q1_04270 [Trichosporon asahii var. asahii CBS 2479]|uniref:Flavin reductase like domain-containing protein n=1 Tax=Trichosporon asahii var. asahii (strain ATCC 90039 / CBS 2479 / JCM 2466 / KCTC 7840 / NBRC 103889/ NCYC 2677 / UAMH 7654) TaxID=1186058 RepID=J6EW53_TRIAS|nr:hypothetical protein A1Q1_04270 [Trichosporon asahii var. asahii CBS 2479]EJT47027.1 hypothetical protein A1Q1_04270 [Trichosporon asahii var. asahii CBS 2479]
MRDVLRNVAQPVVVAVTKTNASSPAPYHGATLTSFASLSLEPYPLVAFSLRLPSKMADYLRPCSNHTIAPGKGVEIPLNSCDNDCAAPTGTGSECGTSPAALEATTPAPTSTPKTTCPELMVSLLSSSNQAIAEALARPGVDQRPIFGRYEWDDSDPPALKDAVGHLRCQVIHSMPLKAVCDGLANLDFEIEKEKAHLLGSELFICRVVDSNLGQGKESLVHYQRDYNSVSN